MLIPAGTLTSALTAGDAYNTLECTSFLPGLATTIRAGWGITILDLDVDPGAGSTGVEIVDGYGGPTVFANSQTWPLTAAVTGAAGTTTLPVLSHVALANFPVGAIVGVVLPI
jgi:hypothetical protein